MTVRELPPDDDTRLEDGTPHWVYVVAGIGAVLLLLFLILHFVGGGFHGHMGAIAGPQQPA